MNMEANTKKRSLINEDAINEQRKKRSKQEDVKVGYGDGVSWFRGSIIGKGSFGCVFLGNSKNPKSKYNSYPPIMAVKSAEISVSGSIQKEKEVMDNIRGCPNVIKCFGEEVTNGENNQMIYNLLLEYGSGGTLADLIKKSAGKGLPELDVRRYARSILRGLRHIHKRGYVHCDLKPDNVLLVSNSNDNCYFNAKIGDFGLAKRANNKKNKLGLNWRGTPMYLSPEAVNYGVQEPPADIWAFGCIVSEMLTGKPLWFSKQDLSVDEILSRIGEEDESLCISSDISKEGRSFLKGCLSRKIMCRLTANMLLDHPFLKGLVEDDAIEVKESHQEVLDINTITSSPVFYDDDDGVDSDDDDDDDDDDDGDDSDDDDDDDEMWLSSYSDGSCYSWSEGENEERTDARFHGLQQYPVTLTISK